jgi:GDP-D-mannose 3', 5'-epimerase
MTRRALVCGAGGFIGGHLVTRLKREGFWVRGVDLVRHEYTMNADELVLGDLRDPQMAAEVVSGGFDDVYQLAADMGGAGYIFSGENDAALMHNSALCNLNVLDACRRAGVRRLFYSSSACVYPEHNQLDPDSPDCSEASAYPAAPDSEYGWEKLFSERLYLAYRRNCGVQVRIARLHNVFGPEGAWEGGREKAPAAICRKVAEAREGGAVQVWGDGKQTRSFLYVDECVEGVRRLVESDFTGPVNIGSEEMISIDALTRMVIELSGKRLSIEYVSGPQGVRGRNSDNRLLRQRLDWAPSAKLRDGLAKTYAWIAQQVRARAIAAEARREGGARARREEGASGDVRPG